MVECNGHFDGPIPPYGTAIRRRGHAGETAKKRNGKETKLTRRRRIPRCSERSERRRKANGPEREDIIIATYFSNNPQTAGRHVHTASRIPDSPRAVNGSSRGKRNSSNGKSEIIGTGNGKPELYSGAAGGAETARENTSGTCTKNRSLPSLLPAAEPGTGGKGPLERNRYPETAPETVFTRSEARRSSSGRKDEDRSGAGRYGYRTTRR